MTMKGFGACLSFACAGLTIYATYDEANRPNPLQCLIGSVTGAVLPVTAIAPLAGCDVPAQPHTRLILSSLNGTVGSSVASVIVTELESYQPDTPRQPLLLNQAPPLWLNHAGLGPPPPRWHTPNFDWPPLPPTPASPCANETLPAGASFLRFFWQDT
jgi:hypothetical protein